KVDDDVYLRPERLLAAVPHGLDYVGRHRGPANGHPAPYCSGFCYWMSKKAMQARVEGGNMNDFNEDLTTGNILMRAGISGSHDTRYAVARSVRNVVCHREGPRRGNDVIASCEYSPDEMLAVHREYLTMPSGVGYLKMPENTPFDRVDVLVKTFLRDGFVERCTNGIEQALPGARMIVVDDGWESRRKIGWYAELRERGHIVQWMPFDSGYGAKNNAGAKHYTRDYVLRIADDFDMGSDAVKEGVLKMLDVLDSDTEVGIVSGRVNGAPYEGYVRETVREDGLKDMTAVRVSDDAPKLQTSAGTEYIECDCTVNFSLIRRELMQSFTWDEKYKIGGDHLDLYMHCWKKGMKVAYCVGVNVDTMPPFPGAMHREYPVYRKRARLALPWAFERHGWNSWTNFDGNVDTRESVAEWVRKNERLMPRALASATVKTYGIDPRYKHRGEVPHFDDTQESDQEYQVEVYDLARDIFRERGFTSVVDIGCGNARKLIDRFGKYVTTGVEVEPTLTWLRANHADRRWLSHDQLDGSTCDLVICSDVIEHVQDPDELLDVIQRLQPKAVVISTPDRSLIPGGMIGPPRNKHHVREWTMPEFAKYLSSRATILRHFISNKSQWTQCAVLDGIGAPGVVARTIMDHMQERKERARIINERVRSSLLEKRKRT
ncbi:MAG TPA: methyltransferase domain-containing protein, partial [Flavobacteriales bacterium]|nr:methyltransferase domain-containing protein [Flavobacteriales bacterium]